MKKRILLVEDDASFGLMLKFFLEMNGFEIVLCENGHLGIETFHSQEFDLCILDVMMPHTDGFTVAENIIKSKKSTPFIFLTAKALKDDQVQGYKLGAADYLIKPFDPEILLLKLNALLQLRTDKSPEQKSYQIGNFNFDYEKRILSLKNQEEKLSPKEADLLKLLCDKQGEILTHEEALIKIWKNDDYFTKQSMNVFITKLRKYLSLDTTLPIEIENIHSKGFLLKIG
ncbi:MAG: response regulator transcription factor [Raineya sp.]|jgi:DNA-binding response OmpR family regulator|nr:response regulator transcription factor [Raineya sp.]